MIRGKYIVLLQVYRVFIIDSVYKTLYNLIMMIESNRIIKGGLTIMKHIISCQVSLPSFTLRKTLELYQLCQTIKSNVYLVTNGKTCEVNYLPKLVSFILTSNNQNILVITEGIEAPYDREKINHFFKQQKALYPA